MHGEEELLVRLMRLELSMSESRSSSTDVPSVAPSAHEAPPLARWVEPAAALSLGALVAVTMRAASPAPLWAGALAIALDAGTAALLGRACRALSRRAVREHWEGLPLAEGVHATIERGSVRVELKVNRAFEAAMLAFVTCAVAATAGLSTLRVPHADPSALVLIPAFLAFLASTLTFLRAPSTVLWLSPSERTVETAEGSFALASPARIGVGHVSAGHRSRDVIEISGLDAPPLLASTQYSSEQLVCVAQVIAASLEDLRVENRFASSANEAPGAGLRPKLSGASALAALAGAAASLAAVATEWLEMW